MDLMCNCAHVMEVVQYYVYFSFKSKNKFFRKTTLICYTYSVIIFCFSDMDDVAMTCRDFIKVSRRNEKDLT